MRTKVFRVILNKTPDTINFDLRNLFQKAEFEKPTKRNVVQFASSIFDPLGLINPLVVKFKLLFQEICKKGINRDDEILVIF